MRHSWGNYKLQLQKSNQPSTTQYQQGFFFVGDSFECHSIIPTWRTSYIGKQQSYQI